MEDQPSLSGALQFWIVVLLAAMMSGPLPHHAGVVNLVSSCQLVEALAAVMYPLV